MSREENQEVRVSHLLRATTLGIWAVILFLALMAIIALRAEIDGNVESFVQKTVQRIEKASTNTPSQQILELAIAKDFTDAFEEMRFRAFIYELLVHLITAGIVALVIIYFIESRIRKFNQQELREFRKEITDNVWQAICSRLVPRQVTNQIESILQSDFVKRDAHYTITLDNLPGRLCNVPDDEQCGWILLKRELTFIIQNISGSDVTYTFRSKILTTADKCMEVVIASNNHGHQLGESLAFPRHELLSIGGERINLKNPDGYTIEHLINLAPQGCCEISHTYCELLRVNDEAYYVQAAPLIGLDVMVSNLIPGRISVGELYISHPEGASFHPKPTHGHAKRCVFEGKAILPGQMFSVQWEALPSTQTELPVLAAATKHDK